MSHDVLKENIEAFLQEKNRPQVYNHRYMSDLLGMTKATFSRTINGKRTPSVEEIWKICQIIGKTDDVGKILQGYYSNQKLENLNFDVKKFPYVLGSFQNLLKNPRYFDILILAKNKSLSLSQYTRDHGTEGLNRIQELIDLEVLRLDDDKLVLLVDGEQLDIPTVKDCIKNALQFHKTSNMGKMRNQVFFAATKVDKTKRTQVYNILNTTRLIVIDILTKGCIGPELKDKMISLMDFDHGDNQGEEEVVCLGLIFDDVKVDNKFNIDSQELLQ